MQKELQDKFYERWPEWFRGRHMSIQENLMPFGFDHRDGWYNLEWQLCEDLEKILAPTGKSDNYLLMQIKEKFGTLRWYDEGTDIPREVWDAIHARIRIAEDESAKTCEVCGKPGETRHSRSWISTLCDEHEEERRK